MRIPFSNINILLEIDSKISQRELQARYARIWITRVVRTYDPRPSRNIYEKSSIDKNLSLKGKKLLVATDSRHYHLVASRLISETIEYGYY